MILKISARPLDFVVVQERLSSWGRRDAFISRLDGGGKVDAMVWPNEIVLSRKHYTL